MNQKIGEQQFKRNVAYKLRINSIIEAKPSFEAENRLQYIETGNKQVVRVNIIANIVDKFMQEGEKKFGSVTLDDGSGQIKIKTFGEDVDKLSSLNQGDTIIVIGMVRHWNNEFYITPEIMKKKDSAFLLIRKLEVESNLPKAISSSELSLLKEKMMVMIKESEKNGGIDIEKMILDLKEPPETINLEIKKLLEDGVIYEPRPGKLRYLG